MWRFLPGCEPPKPKKVKSNEDISESATNYFIAVYFINLNKNTQHI